MKRMELLKASFWVYFAYLTNNYRGKREDVHGRRYKDVYKEWGHKVMVIEYLEKNSWVI